MISDSKLSFAVSSVLSRTEGLSFVSMAVEEETEISSDLRRFAESLKKGFVSNKDFARIINFITEQKKGNRSQAHIAQDFFNNDPSVDGSKGGTREENWFQSERKTSGLSSG